MNDQIIGFSFVCVIMDRAQLVTHTTNQDAGKTTAQVEVALQIDRGGGREDAMEAAASRARLAFPSLESSIS